MIQYHKIYNVFKRNMDNPKRLLDGVWSDEAFDYLQNNEWVFTEKVDGTNIRVMVTDEITFGGKTDNAQIPTPLVKRLQERFLPQKDKLIGMFPDGGCLYGEGYGGKIQRGSKYRLEQGFVLFDVKVGEWWLKREDIVDISEKLEIDVVPVVLTGTLNEGIRFTSTGLKSTWGDFEAEGVIGHPTLELKNRHGGRIITKIKTCDFKD